MLSPQIKITIQSKGGKVAGKEFPQQSVNLQKQGTIKLVSNALNNQSAASNTPNIQQIKGKSDKIIMSNNKGATNDPNQSSKNNKEGQNG